TTRYEGRFWASIADNNYHLKCYMKKGNLKITLSNKKLIGIFLVVTIREVGLGKNLEWGKIKGGSFEGYTYK
ncbi:MAG: hypothetical protein LUQ65_03335, partial [Candidatus Helarchaeota archaeon]|nr:hypothetical protein [Candidatus Helarchaeota archaeon]